MSTSMEIFKDLKVIEFSSVLAGPAVGMFFAELGAQVIKVENKNGGDLTRQWKQPGESIQENISAYYHSVNWNKEVLFLDLKNEFDRTEVNRLLEDADIVISNFKEGDDEKFGLQPELLREKFPALIIGVIKGFEDDNRLAYDAVLQAETGYMSMNGTADSGPLKMPVAFIDLFAAHQLKEAILCALLQKIKTGKGAVVKTSLYRSAIASLANQAANWLNNDSVPTLAGSLHPNIAPYGEIFSSADHQKFLLAVGNDEQFKHLCAGLNVQELMDDPRFMDNLNRVIHRNELADFLQDIFVKFPINELFTIFNKGKVPAGRILNMKQVFDSPFAQKMILRQQEVDGSISKRVSTIAFTLEDNE